MLHLAERDRFSDRFWDQNSHHFLTLYRSSCWSRPLAKHTSPKCQAASHTHAPNLQSRQDATWDEFKPWCGQIEPGLFDTQDLQAARASLYEKGYLSMVAVTHKREPLKLTILLKEGRMTLVREPGDAGGIQGFVSRVWAGLPRQYPVC